jgi:hypothetical protein
MPMAKNGKFYGNAQVARAHDNAKMPPVPPMRQKPEGAQSGSSEDEHGGVAKVETIIHHKDGHKERTEHASTAEAADHLTSGDEQSTEMGDEHAGGEMEPCPECHGHDPNCPLCQGTGEVPKGSASEQSSEQESDQEGY